MGPDLTYNGGVDAFVAKVRPDGTGLVYAGYIGGSDLDQGLGLALDRQGSAYVVGHTHSTEATFPVTGGPDLTFNGGGDAFVAKVRPDGTGLAYAGYIGGAGEDTAFWVAVDRFRNVYIVGDTASDGTTFPDGDGFGLLPGPNHFQHNGFTEAFVARIGIVPPVGGLVGADWVIRSEQDEAFAFFESFDPTGCIVTFVFVIANTFRLSEPVNSPFSSSPFMYVAIGRVINPFLVDSCPSFSVVLDAEGDTSDFQYKQVQNLESATLLGRVPLRIAATILTNSDIAVNLTWKATTNHIKAFGGGHPGFQGHSREQAAEASGSVTCIDGARSGQYPFLCPVTVNLTPEASIDGGIRDVQVGQIQVTQPPVGRTFLAP